MRIDEPKPAMSEAMVCIQRSGILQFDSQAKAAFRRRGIQFACFVDERTGCSTGRCLTSAETRALGEKPRPYRLSGEVNRFGDFLREIGIRTTQNRRYRARWWNSASDHLIVRIK